MFGQTFQFGDIGTIAFLVLLEALLSADNALVLAILVRHLPPAEQKKALFYGLGGAFVLRTAAILLAAYIINFWWLQAVGAAYLLYLPIKHFVDVGKDQTDKDAKRMGFWATVVYLNIVDTAFALDSVIVAVAVVDTVRNPNKLWVVIAGAIIGIVILRFAANAFIRILEKYPRLDHVAYGLVGWAGVKLLFIAAHSFERLYKPFQFDIPEMPPVVFWAGMALIAIGGSLLATRKKAP
jgi:YkoY family integral membrane protein